MDHMDDETPDRSWIRWDAYAAAAARDENTMAVAVDVTCIECGKRCHDEQGQVRTTRNRYMREDICIPCKILGIS